MNQILFSSSTPNPPRLAERTQLLGKNPRARGGWPREGGMDWTTVAVFAGGFIFGAMFGVGLMCVLIMGADRESP